MASPPFNEIRALINRRKQRTLDLAELAMPPEQYQKYRKMVLDEFGEKGLEGELHALFRKNGAQLANGNGMARE